MSIRRFTDIEQYRHVIKDVTYHATHHADGSLIHAPEYPRIAFTGTVKLHGTNAGIEYDFETDRIRYQSRNNFITPSGDNLGFATFMSQHEGGIRNLIEQLSQNGVDVSGKTILYGEWAGPGINKGVGISQIGEKAFFIFAVMAKDEWVPVEKMKNVRDHDMNVFNIYEFKTYSVEVDFANPALAQNEFIRITEEVEAECPVAKNFGISGVGEGVVWHADVCLKRGSPLSRLIFKVKGEKHSVTKVKTLAAVDVEKLNSVVAFADATVTENRLLQGLDQMRQDGVDYTDIRNIGKFLKWVANDVFKEERDTMVASGLVEKDVGKAVSDRAKRWLIVNHINKVVPNATTVAAIEAAERGEVRPFAIGEE